MYEDREESKNLKHGQLVLCKCPEWNEEGYQVATWNGSEFEYSGQPNDMFNDLVVGFIKLDEDGEPEDSF